MQWLPSFLDPGTAGPLHEKRNPPASVEKEPEQAGGSISLGVHYVRFFTGPGSLNTDQSAVNSYHACMTVATTEI